MSRADQTNTPERTCAVTVFKNIWSSMIEPLPVRMMVMLEMSDFSGRTGEGRCTIVSFSPSGSMSSEEMFT